ncbi:MAG: dTMP kinase [Candidatus Diapherotrites archaeon]|nr:dTMP kinase [Candidatus Diapherotrites archaeon]
MRGKFIVFEGVDASGKATQQRLLAERLKKEGYDVEIIDFPDYNAPIGKAIKEFLFERYDIDRETASLLYAADRRQHYKQITNWLKEGKIVLSDRYIYSNIAFQHAAGVSLKWLFEIDSVNVQADYVLLLDLDPKISYMRKKRRDRNERDLKYLTKVRKIYLDMCDGVIPTDPTWVKIDASKSIEEVHNQIWEEVSKWIRK